jgi:hypothetical protein
MHAPSSAGRIRTKCQVAVDATERSRFDGSVSEAINALLHAVIG